MFKLIPQDKANHELYGARIAAVVAIVACLVAEPLLAALGVRAAGGAGFALLLAGAASIAAALAAAIAKEYMDRSANDKAEDAGLPPPHSVEVDDLLATVRGGLSVGLPLVCAWSIYYL